MNLNHRRRVLALSYASLLAFALVFQVVPPVMNLLIEALGLSHTQAGLLMGFFALPGTVLSVPGGKLTDRLGPKRVGMAALALMAAGTLLSGFAKGFAVLAAGRLAAGAGAITLAIVAPQAITRWYDRRVVGSMMGMLNTAVPVGTVLAFNLFGVMGLAWGWRAPVFLTSGTSILLLLLYRFLHPGLPEAADKPQSNVNVTPSGRLPLGVFACALVWMAYNAAAISFLSFAPDYYAASVHNAAFAGFITSLFMAGALVLSYPVGFLTDRAGREPAFIAVGALAMALLLFMVPRTGADPALPVILTGIAAALIPAPLFSLLPKLVAPSQTGTGFGVLSSFLNMGVLTGPFLVGLSYDRTGSYLRGFDLMSAFSLAAVVFVLVLPGKK